MAPPQAEGFRRSSLGQRHSTAIAAGLVSLLLLKQLLVLAGTLWEEACGINRESFFPGKKKYNVRQRGQGSRAGRRVARAQAGARAAGLPRWSSSVGVVLSSSQELVHKARGRDFWQRVPSGGLSHAQVAQGFLGDPTGVIWDHAGSPTACSYRAYLQLLALSVPVHKALLGWSILYGQGNGDTEASAWGESTTVVSIWRMEVGTPVPQVGSFNSFSLQGREEKNKN